MRIADVLHQKGRIIHRAMTTEPVREAVQKLSDHHIGALLVYDPWGKYAGIFSERLLIHALDRVGEAALDQPVGEVMTPDRIVCHSDDHLPKTMSLMTVHRIRHLPVEEGGKIVGIVSIGDLVRALVEEKELEVEVLRDMARSH